MADLLVDFGCPHCTNTVYMWRNDTLVGVSDALVQAAMWNNFQNGLTLVTKLRCGHLCHAPCLIQRLARREYNCGECGAQSTTTTDLTAMHCLTAPSETSLIPGNPLGTVTVPFVCTTMAWARQHATLARIDVSDDLPPMTAMQQQISNVLTILEKRYHDIVDPVLLAMDDGKVDGELNPVPGDAESTWGDDSIDLPLRVIRYPGGQRYNAHPCQKDQCVVCKVSLTDVRAIPAYWPAGLLQVMLLNNFTAGGTLVSRFSCGHSVHTRCYMETTDTSSQQSTTVCWVCGRSIKRFPQEFLGMNGRDGILAIGSMLEESIFLRSPWVSNTWMNVGLLASLADNDPSLVAAPHDTYQHVIALLVQDMSGLPSPVVQDMEGSDREAQFDGTTTPALFTIFPSPGLSLEWRGLCDQLATAAGIDVPAYQESPVPDPIMLIQMQFAVSQWETMRRTHQSYTCTFVEVGDRYTGSSGPGTVDAVLRKGRWFGSVDDGPSVDPVENGILASNGAGTAHGGGQPPSTAGSRVMSGDENESVWGQLMLEPDLPSLDVSRQESNNNSINPIRDEYHAKCCPHCHNNVRWTGVIPDYMSDALLQVAMWNTFADGLTLVTQLRCGHLCHVACLIHRLHELDYKCGVCRRQNTTVLDTNTIPCIPGLSEVVLLPDDGVRGTIIAPFACTSFVNIRQHASVGFNTGTLATSPQPRTDLQLQILDIRDRLGGRCDPDAASCLEDWWEKHPTDDAGGTQPTLGVVHRDTAAVGVYKGPSYQVFTRRLDDPGTTRCVRCNMSMNNFRRIESDIGVGLLQMALLNNFVAGTTLVSQFQCGHIVHTRCYMETPGTAASDAAGWEFTACPQCGCSTTRFPRESLGMSGQLGLLIVAASKDDMILLQSPWISSTWKNVHRLAAMADNDPSLLTSSHDRYQHVVDVLLRDLSRERSPITMLPDTVDVSRSGRFAQVDGKQTMRLSTHFKSIEMSSQWRSLHDQLAADNGLEVPPHQEGYVPPENLVLMMDPRCPDLPEALVKQKRSYNHAFVGSEGHSMDVRGDGRPVRTTKTPEVSSHGRSTRTDEGGAANLVTEKHEEQGLPDGPVDGGMEWMDTGLSTSDTMEEHEWPLSAQDPAVRETPVFQPPLPPVLQARSQETMSRVHSEDGVSTPGTCGVGGLVLGRLAGQQRKKTQPSHQQRNPRGCADQSATDINSRTTGDACTWQSGSVHARFSHHGRLNQRQSVLSRGAPLPSTGTIGKSLSFQPIVHVVNRNLVMSPWRRVRVPLPQCMSDHRRRPFRWRASFHVPGEVVPLMSRLRQMNARSCGRSRLLSRGVDSVPASECVPIGRALVWGPTHMFPEVYVCDARALTNMPRQRLAVTIEYFLQEHFHSCRVIHIIRAHRLDLPGQVYRTDPSMAQIRQPFHHSHAPTQAVRISPVHVVTHSCTTTQMDSRVMEIMSLVNNISECLFILTLSGDHHPMPCIRWLDMFELPRIPFYGHL